MGDWKGEEEKRGPFARFRSRIDPGGSFSPWLCTREQLRESAEEFRFILIKRRSLGQRRREASTPSAVVSGTIASVSKMDTLWKRIQVRDVPREI